MPSLVEQLNITHPEYRLRHNLWRRLQLLFAGGDDLARNASEFLLQRPKEPRDMYVTRSQRFWPQNIIGTVISWYVSALWKKEISIDRKPVVEGDPSDYYSQFLENCDMNHTKFTDFWAGRIEAALLYKRSFVLVDLPKIGLQPSNLRAQLQSGGLDAYLVPYDPKDVINWSLDRFGNLEWVVIKTQEQRQEFLLEPVTVTNWWYFDRQQYRQYQSETRDSDTGSEETIATLVEAGPHAMAGQNQVPLLCLEMPDSLWLGNRMYLQAMDHLNQDNSYAWALFLANLPIPVFKTEKQMEGQAFSEANAVMLNPGDDFNWNETSGVSFQHSSARVDQLREEIYRTAYLIQQGRTSKATPAAQSGYSKELDMMPSRDILNAIGSKLRGGMKAALQAVNGIRGDDIDFSVRGFSFEETDAVAEVALVEQLEEVDFPSDTLRKYQMKRAARALMSDASEEEKDAAVQEIEDSPTIDERKQEALEAQQLRVDTSLSRATTRIGQAVAA